MSNQRVEALKAWLHRRANDHKSNLQRLIFGAGLFFLGYGLIILADKTLPSSIEQELIALLGTGLCVVGILMALAGYLSLSVLRLLSFLHKD